MADDASTTEKTVPKQLTPWQPGQSGNPAGRPKGSRNKLSEDFLADLHADWQVGGIDAIKKVREERPQDYLKVVASVVPKEFNLNANILSDVGDDELAAFIAALQSLQTGRDTPAVPSGAEETTRH